MKEKSLKNYTAGKLAKEVGVNIQTIRFYDRQRILNPISRSESGYRLYNQDSVKRLHFIIQAKELGFSLNEVKELLSLKTPSIKSCDRVKKKSQEKLHEIQKKISHLKHLEKTLKKLIQDCENRVVSDCCPILERIEG